MPSNPPPDVFLDLTNAVQYTTPTAFLPTAGSVDGNLPFWGDDPDAWDQFWVSGQRFPGVAKITCRNTMRRDKKSSPGRAGARATSLGFEPAMIQVTIRMWTKAQWQAFCQLAPSLRPSPVKGPPQPFVVYHPALAAIGVTSAEIVSFSPPEMDSELGVMKVELALEEFISAPTKVTTPRNTTDWENQRTVQNDRIAAQQAKATGSKSGLANPNVRGQ